MRLALYQPDIPQNAGAAIRVAACFGAGLDIVGPCGFPLDDRDLKRAALDYGTLVDAVLHDGWSAYCSSPKRSGGRLVLLTTTGAVRHDRFRFDADDVLMVGRESGGVPDAVHAAAHARVVIPMAPGARSLNVVVAAAVALAEARRQTGWPI